jgi:hypothetical protein
MSDDDFDLVDDLPDYEDDDDYYARDEEIVQGVKQYEHIGEYNPIYQEFGDYDMDHRDRFKKYGALTGDERFRKMVVQYINQNEDLKKLNLIKMNDYITKLKQIEYKNPKAFVIAFLFIDLRDKNSNIVKKVGHYCKETDDMSIEDIVRYVRLIRSL